jgi:hypothetical protein
LKSDDAFVIKVRRSDDALDVFHHPYAHAAWRDIATAAGVSAEPLAA